MILPQLMGDFMHDVNQTPFIKWQQQYDLINNPRYSHKCAQCKDKHKHVYKI